MKTNLILSIDRRNDVTTALQVVDLAVKFRDRGVVGVDLCGDPAVGDVSIFQSAFEEAKKHDLKITIHFAEAPQSSSAKELWTLLSYIPDRIGHVINVPNDVKDEIVKRKLGLELCLSCNVHARMITGTYSDHHFGWWRETGCPIALSVCPSVLATFRLLLRNCAHKIRPMMWVFLEALYQTNTHSLRNISDSIERRYVVLLAELLT
jgi:adenosine deaminase